MDRLLLLAVLMITYTQSVARPTSSNNGDETGNALWPQPQGHNEKIFMLPKKLTTNDNINISGEIKNDKESLTIGLLTGYNSPDYKNIACQLEVNFLPENKMALKQVKNGTENIISTVQTADYFEQDERSFAITFKKRDAKYITVMVGSFYKTVELLHEVEDIRFLSVKGDVAVSELVFKFV